MANLSRNKLDEQQINTHLQSLDGWSVQESVLTKTFEFDGYAKGVMFAAGAGALADALDHHPDLLLTYQKVKVSLTTHDAGGLTEYDFELARRIQELV
jgi:4a-hydroxytetrahydrobiopterin dehydratase